MALAERIKECRTNLGFSQAELAEKIHVSRQAVTKWESGKGYPDIDNLKAMSVLFDVSVDYLLDEEPGPTTGAKMRVPIDLETWLPDTDLPDPNRQSMTQQFGMYFRMRPSGHYGTSTRTQKLSQQSSGSFLR